ncbi:MAG: hypothetical protein KAU62_13170 [Candidatus Heimdallarchaeota archaeon]|nr:hypothetical protein [Candidatus Heimdallarchaeota archaeon]MCK4612102.1 hypothetical protein [Candidatus Heimdallarchaeota archaeon]
MTVQEAFDIFLKKIKPSETELNKARSRRDVLLSKISRDTKIMESYNSGSYIKGTSLTPLNDIDVFLVLPLDEFDETDNMLRYIRDILIQRYGTSGPYIRLQDRSVGIRYSSTPHVDAIPAVAYKKTPQNVQIFDRKEGRWIYTSVKNQIKFLNDRNNVTPKLKNMIRLLKIWKEERRAKYRSYTIELLACKAYENGMKRGWLQGLTQFFEFMVEHKFEEPIIFTDFHSKSTFEIPDDPVVVMDPTNTKNNVAEKMTVSTRNSFINSCNEALNWCYKAIEENNNNHNRIACTRLRNVLGNLFPIR